MKTICRGPLGGLTLPLGAQIVHGPRDQPCLNLALRPMQSRDHESPHLEIMRF